MNGLRIASQKLPASLRPGKVNPLGQLYGVFSEGVHNMPEEDAQALALRLMTAFKYLFENLKEQIDQAEDFAKEMKDLATGPTE